MTQYLDRALKEELNSNPFVDLSTLSENLSFSKGTLIKRMKELSKSGDKNAELWLKTSSIRNKGFIYILQIFAYAFKNGLTTGDVEKMELMNTVDTYPKASILSVLNKRPSTRYIGKSLLKVKKSTLELMKICKHYSLTQEQINYACKEYRINSDIPQLPQISSV